MMEETSAVCEWCERPFRRRRGGSPQRFCGTKCRMAFWTALRRWGERAIDAGVLTIDDIRNRDPAACTLLAGARSCTPVSEAPPQRLAAVAPREESRLAQEEFERLLARTIADRRR
jgi:hypothetical protein